MLFSNYGLVLLGYGEGGFSLIILLKPTADPAAVESLRKDLLAQGLTLQNCCGEPHALELSGCTDLISKSRILAHPAVESMRQTTGSYPKSSRKTHPEDSTVTIGNTSFGGGQFGVIAGPCSVESKDQIVTVARSVQKSGAFLLRGGAFKPRTSPYAFQGMGADGLDLLRHARNITGMPIVSEVMSTEQLPLFEDVDLIQIGARNMQNFELLKAVGRLGRPVLLKRGLSATLEEFVMSAEYILAEGNSQVILCERGIRTFEPSTRNTLDISAVPMLKQMTHLPIIIDPSHAAGLSWMVKPLAQAAVAVGADGLMIEVHNDPPHALSDGEQSLTPSQFEELMQIIRPEITFFGKTLN